MRNRAELEFLLENGRVAEALGDPHRGHLMSPVSLLNYIRICDDIASRLPARARLLDWGCGYGHVSYLLLNRGLDVVSYDVGRAPAQPALPLARALRAVSADDPVTLPFADASFDAVLSCGVLEHVPDEDASLREIRRVLVGAGKLFVYNLPQKWSYKEFVIRRLHAGSTHDRRYTLRSLRDLLVRNGFDVVAAARGGMLPHLFTGAPAIVRRVYGRAAPMLVPLDGLLSRVPVLHRLAQSLEIVAEAAPDQPASETTVHL